MQCANCGKVNQSDPQLCPSCGHSLSLISPVHVRVSSVAIAATIFAAAAIIGFVTFLAAGGASRVPRAPLASNMGAIVSSVAGLIAIVLGIAGIASIWQSGGRRTGMVFAFFAFLTPMCLFGLVAAYAMISNIGATADGAVCGSNLSGIGKAILIYANDFRGEFPRAGGNKTRWTGRTPNWAAKDRNEAFGLNEGQGQTTIAASLYLLVKYAEATPKTFVCPGDKGTTELIPRKYGAADRDLIDLWDFGPNPAKHCSYSYHMPYGKYALTSSGNPDMPVAADRNPLQDGPFKKAKDFKRFSWRDRESAKYGNAYAHENEGQWVLFLDGHVEFRKTPTCGLNEDNIYTIQDGNDIKIGTAPTIGSEPANRQDSLLVTDGAGSDAD